MRWCICLIGSMLLCGCLVQPGYRVYPIATVGPPPPMRMGPPPPVGPPPPATAASRGVPSCRDPSATLLRLYSPGPDPIVVGRTLVRPGWTLLCVPRRARMLVAVQLAGQPPTAVLTRDRRGVIGRPISIVSRDRASTTARVDGRATVLPLAFAAVAPAQPPPVVQAGAPPPALPASRGTAPGGIPAGPPPGTVPRGDPPEADPQPAGPSAGEPASDPESTDSMWDALQGVEQPMGGDSASAAPP